MLLQRPPPPRSPIQSRGRDWRRASPGALEGGRELRAVGPWHKTRAAVSAPTPVRVPFTSRRRLRAAPAASARDAPLGWRRPRNEPPSALVAGMRNRGEVSGGVGGPEEEGGRSWEGKERAGGGEKPRTRDAASWAWRRLRGPTLSAPLPLGAPQMPTPGFVACPRSLHSGSLGAQTESGATEVGLQGRTANQGGRRRETGEGLGAPFSSFAQIRSSWPGWALAREAWMVGWRKASPKRGRQSGIVFPHSTTPPSENPSTSAASALCLPHFSQTLLGHG